MEEMKLTDAEATVHDNLDLVPFTDPKLTQVPTDFDFELENPILLRDKLIEKMRELGGVGLSANQVGLDKKVFVIGDDGDFTKAYFNPEVIGCSEDTTTEREGCLSFPGLWLMVERPTPVAIKYWTEENEEIVETYQGVTARVIQHEYDHMVGMNFTQRVSRLKLERALKGLEKKVKKYQRQGKQVSEL